MPENSPLDLPVTSRGRSGVPPLELFGHTMADAGVQPPRVVVAVHEAAYVRFHVLHPVVVAAVDLFLGADQGTGEARNVPDTRTPLLMFRIADLENASVSLFSSEG